MTHPDPTTQPVAPVPDPIGDFTKPSFWQSPSSYVLIARSYLPYAGLSCKSGCAIPMLQMLRRPT